VRPRAARDGVRARPDSPLKVGHELDVPGRGAIVEYVPLDEEIGSWKHLVTIQFLEGQRRTPEVVASGLAQQMRGHGGTLHWNVLERDANPVLYEWSLLDCPKKGEAYRDQCELARFLRGNDGLHRVAYTERARSMDPARRAHYLGAFQKAYVVKGENRQPIVLAP
jgi:hypothetical protein